MQWNVGAQIRTSLLWYRHCHQGCCQMSSRRTSTCTSRGLLAAWRVLRPPGIASLCLAWTQKTSYQACVHLQSSENCRNPMLDSPEAQQRCGTCIKIPHAATLAVAYGMHCAVSSGCSSCRTVAAHSRGGTRTGHARSTAGILCRGLLPAEVCPLTTQHLTPDFCRIFHRG